MTHRLTEKQRQDQEARRKLYAHGDQCPECAGTRTESNGGRAERDEEFRCIDCDARWGYEAGEPYNF